MIKLNKKVRRVEIPQEVFLAVLRVEEIRAAALQFVRKISGFDKISTINAEAFENAVGEITLTSKILFNSLTTNAVPKNREVESEKERERNRIRFGTA